MIKIIINNPINHFNFAVNPDFLTLYTQEVRVTNTHFTSYNYIANGVLEGHQAREL